MYDHIHILYKLTICSIVVNVYDDACDDEGACCDGGACDDDGACCDGGACDDEGACCDGGACDDEGACCDGMRNAYDDDGACCDGVACDDDDLCDGGVCQDPHNYQVSCDEVCYIVLLSQLFFHLFHQFLSPFL